MWFLFGFITLISFSIYFGLQRYQANWKGTDSTVDNHAFKYFVAKHKGSFNKLLIGCDEPSKASFSIKKESWLDCLFKALGISVEHQVGVDEFDKEFYLIMDDENLAKLFSTYHGLHDEIKKIVELCGKHKLKFKKLICRHGRIWLELIPEDKSKHPLIMPIASDLILSLKKISSLLQYQGVSVEKGKRDPFIIKAMIILAISTGLAVNALAHFFRVVVIDMPFTVDNSPLFQASLPFGLLIIGLFIFFTLVFLGRTARTHIVLIELVLVGSFGAISSSYLFMRDINIDLDTEQPEYFSVKIHDKKISRSRRSTSYSLKIDDWVRGSGL